MIHMLNAVIFIEQTPSRWNPGVALEPLVASSAQGLDDAAADLLDLVPECVQRAAATHSQLQAFPGLPQDTWFRGASAFFYQLPQGAAWWSGGPNPYAAPCS